MGSKDAPQKIQFLDTIKKLASLDPWRQNAQWWKISTESTVIGSNRSDSKFSWIFQQPMDGDKYAYVVLWAKQFLGKSSCLSKIPHGKQENPRISVSVFKLTALLLKKIHLLLH